MITVSNSVIILSSLDEQDRIAMLARMLGLWEAVEPFVTVSADKEKVRWFMYMAYSPNGDQITTAVWQAWGILCAAISKMEKDSDLSFG